MGRRRPVRQEALWVATSELPRAGAHPFYDRVNEILNDSDFDLFVEDRCRKFYAEKVGRPSLPPAIYFRLLMIGYFEGIDSERGIAHCYDTGGMRCTHPRGHENILNRLLIHGAELN